MSPTFDAAALWLADFHLLAGALLAVVLVALAALRQPAQRMAVEKSTLAALAALAVLCALPGWSLVHLLAAEPPTPVVAAKIERPTAPLPAAPLRPDMQLYPAPLPAPALVPNIKTPSAAAPMTGPQASVEPPPSLNWPALAFGLHAGGSALIVAWLALGAILVRRVRRATQPASAELAQALRRVAASSEEATVPDLRTSDRIASPVAVGLRRPTIILPASIAADRRDLAAILAHEHAHIAAGDLRTLAASRLLLVLLWPQPLYWLLRRRLRLDQETLADAAAAEVAGRVGYAEQLLGWARTAAPRCPRLAGAVGLWEGPSQLKHRIATLLDERLTVLRNCTRRWRFATALLGAVAAIALSLVTLQPATVAAPDSPNANASSDSNEPERQADRDAGLPEKVTISGRIVTDDGSPATVKGWLYSDTKADNSSYSSAEGQFTDEFSVETYPGTVWLKYFPDGFAPAWAGPLEIRAGEPCDDVTLVLKPGFSAPLVILDPAGAPIPDATVRVHPEIGGDAGGPNFDQRTDAQGRLVLEHLADTRYQVTVEAPGFQHFRSERIAVQPDDEIRLTLQPSRPATGVIRTADGRPAAGALLLCHFGTDMGFRHERTAEDATAVADAEGRFTIDQLVDGAQYLFVVETTDSARTVVTDIAAGAENMTIVVPERRDLRGRIIGDLAKLYHRNGRPIVFLHQEIRLQNATNSVTSTQLGGEAEVTPTPDGGEFVYEGLVDGPVEVSSGDDLRQKFETRDSGDTTIEFRLGPEEAAAAATGWRPVVSPEVIQQRKNALLQKVQKQPNAVTGFCVDANGEPLADAEVTAYDLHQRAAVRGQAKSGPDGAFTIDNIADLTREFPAGARVDGILHDGLPHVLIVARAAGRATSYDATHLARVAAEGDLRMFELRPAAPVRGVVTGPDGRPIASATVSTSQFAAFGIHTATTDADGRYEIADLSRYGVAERKLESEINGAFSQGHVLTVEHPLYEKQQAYYTEAPSEVDVTLANRRPARSDSGVAARAATAGTPGGGGLLDRAQLSLTEELPTSQSQAFLATGEAAGQDQPAQLVDPPANGQGWYLVPARSSADYNSYPVAQVNTPEPAQAAAGESTPAAAADSSTAVDTDADATTAGDDAATTHTSPGRAVLRAIDITDGPRTAAEGETAPTVNAITVRCLDTEGAPRAGVTVALYRYDFRANTRDLLSEARTDAAGQVQFTDLVPAERTAHLKEQMAARDFSEGWGDVLQVIARGPGMATTVFGAQEYEVGTHGYRTDVTIPAGQRLAGRVTAADGSPVAGALVVAGGQAVSPPAEGLNAVRTDADGRYEFTDRPPFDAATARAAMNNYFLAAAAATSEATPEPNAARVGEDREASKIVVSHPDFAVTTVQGGDIPGTVDVKLLPAAAIRGRVVMSDGSAAPAGLRVTAWLDTSLALNQGGIGPAAGDWSNAISHSATTPTEADGRYEFHNLPPGVYDIWVSPPKAAAGERQLLTNGHGELAVPPGAEPVAAPDLVIGPGIHIRGQLIDGTTGQPLKLATGGEATIIGYPVSAPRVQESTPTVAVTADGKFEVDAAPRPFRIFAIVYTNEAPQATSQPSYQIADSEHSTGRIYQGEHGDTIDATATVWPAAMIEKRREQITAAHQLVPPGADAESARKAAAAFTVVIDQYPDDIDALLGRAGANRMAGDFAAAVADLDRVLELRPGNENALLHLSDVLATCSDDAVRNGPRAVELATQFYESMQAHGEHSMFARANSLLAAAHAEAGDFAAAIAAQEEAIRLSTRANGSAAWNPGPNEPDAELQRRLELYRKNQPLRK